MIVSQEILNLVGAAGFALMGWLGRVVWVAVRDLEKDIAKLRETLPQTYLPKTEARELIMDLTKEIRDQFNRVFLLIEHKADK